MAHTVSIQRSADLIDYTSPTPQIAGREHLCGAFRTKFRPNAVPVAATTRRQRPPPVPRLRPLGRSSCSPARAESRVAIGAVPVQPGLTLAETGRHARRAVPATGVTAAATPSAKWLVTVQGQRMCTNKERSFGLRWPSRSGDSFPRQSPCRPSKRPYTPRYNVHSCHP